MMDLKEVGHWYLLALFIIVASLVVAFVNAWWERRRRDKELAERDKLLERLKKKDDLS